MATTVTIVVIVFSSSITDLLSCGSSVSYRGASAQPSVLADATVVSVQVTALFSQLL